MNRILSQHRHRIGLVLLGIGALLMFSVLIPGLTHPGLLVIGSVIIFAAYYCIGMTSPTLVDEFVEAQEKLVRSRRD